MMDRPLMGMLKRNKNRCIAAILIMSILLINGCTTPSHLQQSSHIPVQQANQTVIIEAGFMSDLPQTFDELVGSVDLIILGTVTDSITLGNGGDLYKVRPHFQWNSLITFLILCQKS